jgi:selT/selW/selH-like putative selenoprotein
MELRNFLVQRYPQLDPESIEGGNYPAPEPHATFARVMGTLQLMTMPLLLFGGMGGEPAEGSLLAMLQEHKMTIFFMVYIGNVIAQNAAQTGAFEIEYNGKLVYSKLAMQRLPTLHDIVNGFKQHGLALPS